MLKNIVGMFALFCYAQMSLAKPCIGQHGSCFKLNNSTTYPIRINCHHQDFRALFTVEAAPQSSNSTQFDISLSDGLGSPNPGQMNCTLYVGHVEYAVNFYNPYYGPTIEFNMMPDASHLHLSIHDRWGTGQKHLDFNW